ncbi:GldG family protein [bacterium]|nr:GldG family protein [bacterium]
MKKLNSASILSILFLLGILVMVNAIGIRYFLRADLTSANMYSLAKASKNIVGSVEDKILVKAYFSPNLPGNYSSIERYLHDMLDDYRAYSHGHFEYEFINPGNEQKLEEEAQSFQIPPRQFQVVENDKIEVVKGYTGVAFVYGDKKEALPSIDNIDNLEYEITSLIKRITTDRQPILGVASTGTEQDRQQMQKLYEALGRNYNVQPVDLDKTIEKGVDGLLILAPRLPFTDWQLFNIDQYIINGGKAMMLMNWYHADIREGQQAMPYELNINKLLNAYGIGLGEDMISDANCATVGMTSQQGFFQVTQPVRFPYFPVIQTFNPSNIITRDLQKIQTYYPSSVDTTLAAAKGFTVQGLMYTSNLATRDTGPAVYLDPFRRRTKQDFPESHIPIAALVRGKFKSFLAESGPPAQNKDGEAYSGPFKAEADAENRLILVGDGHLGIDQYIDAYGLMFMQNAIDWLIQSEDLIAIRSKQIPQKPLKDIPPVAKKFVKWGNLFGPTILIIILGIVLWQVRRIKKKALMAL